MASSLTLDDEDFGGLSGLRARAAENLSQAAYEKIKSDILSSELPPGTRLRVGLVCGKYGFGSSPVREALTLLSGEGLVTRTEGRGFSVADISAEKYVELTETRCWLEEIALRNSMQRGGEEWENAIVVAFYRLSRVSRPAAGTSLAVATEWTRRHAAFHDALISECGSRWLFAYCQQLREQAYRYKRFRGEEPPGGTVNEHEALMKVVLDRHPEVAVPRLAQHYRSKTEAILDGFRKGVRSHQLAADGKRRIEKGDR